MTLANAFWVIMLLWLIFGVWRNWSDRYAMGGDLLVFVLFLLVGWKAFGPPIHG